MENSKLELVYLTPEELLSKKNVVILPEKIQKELANTFYGGYHSGTAPMGHVPNAITVKS